jgi:glycine/D-amino acid oxidase-like deaminating enzyme
VIILGSGLAGLWSAYYIKKFHPKLRVLILDKGIIPTGASTRNAGFACYGSLTELLDDAKKAGEDEMIELVTRRYQGLRRIRKVLSKKEIDYVRNGGYELITNQQYPALSALKKDINWLNAKVARITGRKKVFRIADKKIKRFGFKQVSHLVENDTEAQLHSGKMVQCLLTLVQSMGVTVLNQVEVKRISSNSSGIMLESNLPEVLKTNQLLICTNAFSQQLFPEVQITPARGQVLVTSPLKDLKFKGTFHYDEGFYYFRDLGNRVLLGGARNKAFSEEETTDMDVSSLIQDELERFLRDVVLPGETFTIDHRWSGIMGMGKSKTPEIKKLQKNIYCAVGLGGMGVTLAPILGEEAAKLMSK